jgi:hypothetical protein
VATQASRIKRRQAPGREWREVDVPRVFNTSLDGNKFRAAVFR